MAPSARAAKFPGCASAERYRSRTRDKNITLNIAQCACECRLRVVADPDLRRSGYVFCDYAGEGGFLRGPSRSGAPEETRGAS